MKKVILLFVISLALGCASMAYTYYGIVPSQGILLGKEPKDDKPITVCEPDDKEKGKCVVLFTAEWEKVRADIISLQEQLKTCQGK